LAGEQISSLCSRLVVIKNRKLSDRTRKAYSQFPARVVVAEQYISDRSAGLLPEIKTLEYRGHFFCDVIHRKRSAVDQYDHHRFACLYDRLYQLVLASGQVQTVPISEVIVSPSFFVGVFVSSYHQHRHVGVSRRLYSLGDQLCIFSRIAEPRGISPPVPAFLSNLAALSMGDRHLCSRFLGYAFQYAHSSSGIVAVAAQVDAIGVRSDDRNRLDSLKVQRQQIVLVLQQHNRPSRRLSGEGPMLGRICH